MEEKKKAEATEETEAKITYLSCRTQGAEAKVVCLSCKTEVKVKLVAFGHGYIATCPLCKQLAYNGE